MLRFIGFIAGAVVAIAALVFVLGMPRLPAEPDASGGSETAADHIPPAGAAIDAPTQQPADDDAATGAAGNEVVQAPQSDATTTAAPLSREVPATADEVSPPVPAPAEPIRDEPATTLAEPLPAAQTEAAWHVFWSPFASRIAADGFVSRLESVTGFDYRVVRIDTGVYEVAFAYAGDAERASKLEAIRRATGLELPDT